MTMREPVAKGRMMVNEGATKSKHIGSHINEKTASKTSFPEHTRGALFTARVTKHASAPAESTFQPVLSPEIGDDEPDFPLEELEEASKNGYNLREMSFHDDTTVEYGQSGHDADDDHEMLEAHDNELQYISESEEENDDEVSHISQSNPEPDSDQNFMGRKASPALSDSGASSAFSPAKRSLPASRGNTPTSTTNSRSAADQAGATNKPPRSGSATLASTFESVAKPSTRPTSASNLPPTASNNTTHMPKARISVQTKVPQSPSYPPQFRRPIARHHQGTSTPVASNRGTTNANEEDMVDDDEKAPPPIIVSNSVGMGVTANATPKSSVMDLTPLVANGRKTLLPPVVTPSASPDRTPEEQNTNSAQDNNDNKYETSSDWSRSAVDQVTSAVGTLARLGQSFLQGGGAVLHPPTEGKQASAKDSTPLARQNHSMPQYQGSQLSHLPGKSLQLGTRAPAPVQSLVSQGSSPKVAQPFPQDNPMNILPAQTHPGSEDSRNDLSSALEKMNLEESDMSEDKQQHVYPQLGVMQSHLHMQLHSQPNNTPSIQESTYGSAYGVFSQTNTEHISNQKNPIPLSSTLAAALNPRTPTALTKTAPSASMNGGNHQAAPPALSNTAVAPGDGTGLTPMMRMRNTNSEAATANDHQSVVSNGVLSQGFSQSVLSGGGNSQSVQSHSMSQLTEEEFHAMKQRKWKEKKKLADRSKARERQKLEGGKKKKEDRIKRKRDASSDGLVNIEACQSGFQLVISNMMNGSCGRADDDDDDDDSDDEDSTMGESTEASEDDDTLESSIQSSVKSSIRSSIKSSVKSSIRSKSIRGKPSTDSLSRLSSKLSSRITEEESYMAATTDGSRTETTGGFSSKINMEKFKDKAFIKKFISEISVEGIKVLHHKEAGGNSLTQPHRVLTLLKLGSQSANGNFSEPRLEIRNEDQELVLEFDLFGVRSLEKASVMKLKAYPLSLPGNSILIRLGDGDHVFEAPNEEAAARFVHGMRWLIARLSFNLIIGNAPVSCELLEFMNQSTGDMGQERAMNSVANRLADKTTQFVTI